MICRSRSTSPGKLVVLLLLLLLLSCHLLLSHSGGAVEGKILKFKKHEFQMVESNPWWLRYSLGMYSSRKAPMKTPPGNGASYMDITLTVSSSVDTEVAAANSSQYLEFVFIEYDKLDLIGHEEEEGHRSLCVNGSMAIDPNAAAGDEVGVFYRRYSLPADIKERYHVVDTSMYFLYIARCNEAQAEKLVFDGAVTFMQPYGHLQGEFFGLIPFYTFICIAYVLIVVVWALLILIYRKDITKLQLCLSCVLGLALLEMLMIYLEVLVTNYQGEQSMILVPLTIILTLARKTVSRVLILIVCQGFSITTPSLPRSTLYKVLGLGLFYYSMSCLFEIGKALYYAHMIHTIVFLLMTSPVSLVDGAFYAWIFLSLAATMRRLATHNQHTKLRMYKVFLVTLICYTAVTVAWTAAEFIYNYTSAYYTQWKWFWTFESMWDLYFMIVLGVVLILWRPNRDNKRYMYHQQLPSVEEAPNNFSLVDEDDEEYNNINEPFVEEEMHDFGISSSSSSSTPAPTSPTPPRAQQHNNNNNHN